MSDEFRPGDKARIRRRSRSGRPLNWYDDGRTVELEPGEEITIAEPFEGFRSLGPLSRLSLFDFYWFTHPRLARPKIIDSWSISPASEARS